MRNREIGLAAGVLLAASLNVSLVFFPPPDGGDGWSQWGQNAQHTGMVSVPGQDANRTLADIAFDTAGSVPTSASGSLLVHYQAPLAESDNVYMAFKTGRFTGLQSWETQVWNEKRLQWDDGQLVERWSFQSDWKPVPYASARNGNGPRWEPVFHGALAGGSLYVPGLGGTVYKLNRIDGTVEARINPFGGTLDGSIFVVGPLSADGDGNVYYNAMKLDTGQPWDRDVVNSWMVKVQPDGTARTGTFASLLRSAAILGETVPAADAPCRTSFSNGQLPWPPSPDAVPATTPCGSQRPGINVAPAIARDGTIYTVSRGQFSSRHGYLIAVNPDLTGKWAASLRGRLADGCNDGTNPEALLPLNGKPGGCRAGARPGVDPASNEPPQPGRAGDVRLRSPQ